MDSTQQLIASLAASPVSPRVSAHPLALFAKWFAGCMGYVAVVLFFMGVRDDIFIKLQAPFFLSEVLLLLLVIITAGISAVVLSYPDMHQKRVAAFSPIVPLVAFWLLLAAEWAQSYPLALQPVHGAECLMCITGLSLLPGAVMLWILKRQASVHYYSAGAVAVISAFGVGALALRLSEKTDSVAHLVQWHYLPMLGFALLGLLLGRRLLKW